MTNGFPQQLAGDNYAGICPEALEALNRANRGHVQSYGEDPWTHRACDLFREVFETDCEAFFVFTGTAANSLALASLCQSYHAIIAHELAHIETDECGAPQFFSNGAKILAGGGPCGKLMPQEIERLVTRRTDLHYPKPKVVSLTQSTELGTVYTPDELGAIGTVTADRNLRVQMDGARFANAVVSLGVAPKEISWRAGVDVLCLGGTKNGLPIGEVVIFFRHELAEDFEYRCKQAGQLASKMRFLAAPWVGVLESGAWLEHARHANECAATLEEKLRGIECVNIQFPREANAVFVEMPDTMVTNLHEKGWRFYTFIGTGGARLMCAWDTKEETIDAFVDDVKDWARGRAGGGG
ncbi:MAG: threonine aldolase [Chitinivibrionales bacterium]|nr:threonine aldolase [Chitinivibrionales bacterium]MBD3357179.1 threonine aldolase [Chitinivibrionales bacterium]